MADTTNPATTNTNITTDATIGDANINTIPGKVEAKADQVIGSAK